MLRYTASLCTGSNIGVNMTCFFSAYGKQLFQPWHGPRGCRHTKPGKDTGSSSGVMLIFSPRSPKRALVFTAGSPAIPSASTEEGSLPFFFGEVQRGKATSRGGSPREVITDKKLKSGGIYKCCAPTLRAANICYLKFKHFPCIPSGNLLHFLPCETFMHLCHQLRLSILSIMHLLCGTMQLTCNKKVT